MKNNENKDSPYGQVKEDYESGQNYQEAKFETSQERKKVGKIPTYEITQTKTELIASLHQS